MRICKGVAYLGVCLVCRVMRCLVTIHVWRSTRGSLTGVCKACTEEEASKRR